MQVASLCFVYSIIIIIADECLLISRLRGRVPWSNFQGQCRACETESRRMTICERRGVEMDERRGSKPLSPEREAQLSLFLYTGRGRRHETPPRSLVT